MLNRRFFLRDTAVAAAGMGLLPSFLARAAMQNSNARKNKTLITIFQRGAADGLNLIVPFGEDAYYKARPGLAIAAPSRASATASAIDLDGFFGMHPLMAPLKPIFDAKHMAIVHAVGSPDNTRSHFDAQDFLESGTPGVKGTSDGWLNRHLTAKPDPQATLFRAVALCPGLPRMLRGEARAIAMSSIAEFQLSSGEDAFRAMYRASGASGGADLVYGTGNDTMAAVDALRKVNPLQYQPRAGVEYPDSTLGRSLKQIAQFVKANVGVEVAFADNDGWDTHANQAGSFDAMLGDLTKSIAALYNDLGDRMDDVVILTFSEFGRAVSENGNRGTDHGHANAMMLLGGGVRGGRVYGRWPGLQKEQLYENRDLAVTTDFRLVFGEVLQNHLGNRKLDAVFPGFTIDPAKFSGAILARA